MEEIKEEPPRYRFSLRTLFVLVTVICVWLGYHLKWIRERREAREWIQVRNHIYTINNSGRYDTPLSWSLRILGEKRQTDFAVFADDRRREELSRIFPEAQVKNGLPAGDTRPQ